ncbi:unnamed protein product [Lathyrus oleraceus]|uniref:Uncharacterized protein n=1 Tax=Pisum sativum TaxID=3888 RepID=A0A9D4XGG5_PEA|nr:transcription factor MYB88-like isoform X2 [Pisum sativum]KAI5419943.1 hypothetical protein KIW84_043927 [Pisum sativum]
MEPSKDSSESSECSPRSTPPPKSSEDNLKISLNQVIGPELEGILSTEKVEQDRSPYCEEQINASSRTEYFSLPATPIFRSLAEEIPSPKFSESEKSFLRKTLGVESPSINSTVHESPPL